MLLKQEGLLHKGPEFCQAFKFVIKLQISTLLQQLAESGEESVVLTANVLEGTADHLGSHRGAGFLEDQEQLQKQFLTYCTATRRLSMDDDAVTMPTTISYGNNSMHSPTQACNPLVSPNIYHRNEPVRPRYERESSTSDSVFSPNRRKSSASSKSLDEDVAMLSSHEYSDTARSLSESSSIWPEHPSMLSVDLNEKGTKYSINRSPTSRITEMSDKIKHVAKSPMTESVESIKQITLSSPTEFHYKRHHHQQPSTSPAVPVASPVMTSPHQLVPPKSVQLSSGSSSEDGSYNTKSNIGCAAGALSPDRDISDVSPVNLVSTSVKAGLILNPVIGSVGGSECGLSPFFMYRVPFHNYSDVSLKQNSCLSDTDNNNFYKMKHESEELENKYKSPYAPQDVMTSQSESNFVLGESREYHSESGETYRLHKKAETKNYHRQGGRKQPKSCIERRMSETMTSQSYEVSPPCSASTFVQMKDQNLSDAVTSKTADMVTPPDLSKNFEDALKVQQNIFHSSLGLLSPLQSPFLPPVRPHISRERSQSMSEFHSMTSPEPVPTGRSRFPSSSFVENLDAPLIIDDDMKIETGSQEGLDLSNKKRKMSVDDVYQSAIDEQTDSSNVNISTNQNDDQDYDRLGLSQGSQNSTGSRDDQSTKKYGKGNFIKVSTGYQCRICCRVIRHMNNTTAHMRIHANIKPYKCQVCNQQFKYEVDRRYHFSKTHVDLFSKMHFTDEKKTG